MHGTLGRAWSARRSGLLRGRRRGEADSTLRATGGWLSAGRHAGCSGRGGRRGGRVVRLAPAAPAWQRLAAQAWSTTRPAAAEPGVARGAHPDRALANLDGRACRRLPGTRPPRREHSSAHLDLTVGGVDDEALAVGRSFATRACREPLTNRNRRVAPSSSMRSWLAVDRVRPVSWPDASVAPPSLPARRTSPTASAPTLARRLGRACVRRARHLSPPPARPPAARHARRRRYPSLSTIHRTLAAAASDHPRAKGHAPPSAFPAMAKAMAATMASRWSIRCAMARSRAARPAAGEPPAARTCPRPRS